ncbi:MAG: DUF1996 domain-containing protein [Ilumatobacter sp.]|nr:DUF1996 domain-containing protein [Ilumatobacter sp.]
MRLRVAAALAAVTLLAAATCTSCGDDGGEQAWDPHTSATSLGRPDRPVAGPQGAQAQFLVECGYSHAALDDPIVFPGQPGLSHLHAFFGNTHVDAFTTVGQLPGGETTCDQQQDAAAYWAPALLRSIAVIDPVKSTAYYRPGLDVDPATVQAMPAGLVMIAGDANTEDAQPVEIVAWSCGTGIERAVTPPTCVQGRNLRLIVTFPDCWDGVNLDSPNHHTHVAYSSGGQCPKGYPVPILQLQFSVEYPVTGDPEGLLLASGGLLSGHADFMNGWDQEKLESEVALCIHRDLVCGVTSGRKTG